MVENQVISSRENQHFKALVRLGRSKEIKVQEKTLICGLKQTQDFYERYQSLCLTLILAEEAILPADHFALTGLAEELPKIIFSQKLFAEIDVLGTGNPLLLAKLPQVKSLPQELAGLKTLVLPLQDPQNVGLCLRAAAAFNLDQVLLTKECASPFLPRALRAGGLAAFALPLVSLRVGLKDLAKQDWFDQRAYVLDMKGRDIASIQLESKHGFCLIVGEEGAGIKQLSDFLQRVTIPQSDKVESLNAAQAVSIALYALSSKT